MERTDNFSPSLAQFTCFAEKFSFAEITIKVAEYFQQSDAEIFFG